MPIFWLTRLVNGSGRARGSSPRQKASIEIAASWPCATAVMMFFGPNAASPPKKTFGRLDWNVTGSTAGKPLRSKCTPASLSIQGNAFSWPTAMRTSSHSIRTSGSPVGTRRRRPRSSFAAVIFSNTTPVRRPASCMKAFGAWKFRIATPSRIASSFSQGEAFISANPERTTTLTSAPPRRRAVRQQSMAVLPPPSTTTRRPIEEIWPNDTLDSQSMPIWMFWRRFARARECRGCGRAARRSRRKSRRSLRAAGP